MHTSGLSVISTRGLVNVIVEVVVRQCILILSYSGILSFSNWNYIPITYLPILVNPVYPNMMAKISCSTFYYLLSVSMSIPEER